MDSGLVEEHTDTDPKEFMALLRRDEKLEIEETIWEIMAVINSLGADTANDRRERMKSIRAIVFEIYFPPRVTAATKLLPEFRIVQALRWI